MDATTQQQPNDHKIDVYQRGPIMSLRAKDMSTTDSAASLCLYAAAAKVFHTPELLENILEQAPPRAVLVLQRVSKQFRDTVQGSIRLQRHLFLGPVLRPMSASGGPRHPDNVRFKRNGMIGHFVGPFKGLDYPSNLDVAADDPPTFCDALSLESIKVEYYSDVSPYLDVRFNVTYRDVERFEGFAKPRPNESCRKMLAVQPPLFTIEVTLEGSWFDCLAMKTFEPSSTIGEIVDWLEANENELVLRDMEASQRWSD